MARTIKEYFLEAGLDEDFALRKVSQYEKHPDIAAEFEYWISNGTYRENGIEIEGYTAAKLGKMSEYLYGEGSFSMLIMLNEKPEKAKKKIADGFRLK